MTSTAALPVNRARRGRSDIVVGDTGLRDTAFGSAHVGHTQLRHAHLWALPDGTGLHAPPGELVIEADTGRVCCHLCGRWFLSLGGHLRKHGHTADSYREIMGLCRSHPLVAETLSRAIATRQTEAYRRSPELRARLAVGQEFSRSGQLATLAHTVLSATASPERTRLRRAALEAGRMTRAAQRDQALTRRLHDLGFGDLGEYLRHAYRAGASLRTIAKATGLGWVRLRREIDAAGITVRPSRARIDATELRSGPDRKIVATA